MPSAFGPSDKLRDLKISTFNTAYCTGGQ